MFSDKDLIQISERGSDISLIKSQIENFKKGFPSLQLTAAPNPGSGIKTVTEKEKSTFIDYYEQKSQTLDVLKFVPASGAATRMFKELFAFLSYYDSSNEAYEKLTAEGENNAVFKFLKNLENFAFYDLLKDNYQKLYNESIEEGHLKRKYKEIIHALLSEDGLNYGNLPKALLKFHQYDIEAGSSIREHFVEGAKYAKGNGDVVNLHFTVSPHHRIKFEEEVNAIKGPLEQKYGVTYQVNYSVQKPSTDTIAVDMENNPFRNEDGTILFRPAGHGALLENLNEVSADVIFIKNIDNVVPEHLQQTTYDYKKVLAGVLLSYADKVSDFLRELTATSIPENLSKYESLLFKDFMEIDDSYSNLDQGSKVKYLIKKFNRPMRACGMVVNEGDPGGGPFFAINPDKSVSAQIAETAQVDLSQKDQEAVFKQATHFNPADLACKTKDYLGNPFNLLEFRDSNTGFITKKSKDGKDLKAQELPGLWNGAMSDWLTIFVEVPSITFNPVKTINDLLKKEHQ